MAVSLATCPRCGSRLEEKDTHCTICGIDLSAYRDPALRPFLADSAETASLPFGEPLTHPYPGSIAEAAPVPFDYMHLTRPARVEEPLNTANTRLIIASLIAVGSAVMLLFNLWMLLSEMRDYNRLMNEGVVTTAVITNRVEEEGDDSTDYYIHYQFKAPVGGVSKQFQKKHRVSYGLYSQARVGQPIEVVYWPGNPAVTGIKSELRSAYIVYLIWSGISGLILVSGMFNVLVAGRSTDHLDELHRNGQRIHGVVFDRWKQQDEDDENTKYCIAYAFQSNDGKVMTSANYVSYDDYARYREGTAVFVRYLPNNPRISMIEKPV